MAKPKRKGFFDFSRAMFFALSGLFALVPTALFVDLLLRAGFSQELVALSALFAILSWNVAWGATHSLVGFCARRGGRSWRGHEEPPADQPPGSVAVTLPVYNEDPVRVFAGLRAMYLSLQGTGHADRFDFFILSDSNRAERWVQEEQAWAKLCRDLNAFGRINYRRRKINKDKKAGNIHEFCESWGSRYRYMVTLDADSILSGDTMVEMYRRMEANPRIGILQTAPRIVFAESFWGRLQQFANHFYGPIFTSGLDFWQRGEGNYWGHNAIIRMAPFMEHCALPDLPGREPFGGKILSHDFVEAALMQRAGYEARLAHDLGDSFEECPPDLIEHAKRDRRWCQGNMQHVWLLFSRGIKTASRIHLMNGIMGYASSLFWAAFLALGGIYVFNRDRSDLSVLPVPAMGNLFEMPLASHAALVAAITFSLLFLPRVLALLDAILARGRAASYGGFGLCFVGVAVETLFSALSAPVLMLYHAKFVIFTAFGKGVGWTTQKRRSSDGLALGDAFAEHWGHALVGLGATALASQVNAALLYWMLPVTGSLALSPFISWLVSKPSVGLGLKRIGILATPEERQPTTELVETQEAEAKSRKEEWLFRQEDARTGFMNAVVDPYLNAIRASLAASDAPDDDPEEALALGRKALREGPDALDSDQRKRLLSAPDALLETHRLAWVSDPSELDPRWLPYFRRYTPAVS